jgi:malonyl-CoA O-methyltransferase
MNPWQFSGFTRVGSPSSDPERVYSFGCGCDIQEPEFSIETPSMRLRNLIKRTLTITGLRQSAGLGGAIVDKLDARTAYDLWAATYSADSAPSVLDEELAQQMLAGLSHTRLLDAGCGNGRRIAGIPGAIGMDLSPNMLAAGAASNVVTGDVRAIPFYADRFDMVWCRLVLGYIPDLLPAYRELARVCAPGGHLLVTDFHPAAVAAGHRRTFNDQAGVVHEIENYVHTNHIDVALNAGLTLVSHRDAAVGPSVRDLYLRGIGLKAYKRDEGLKLISAFLFRRP